MQSPQLDHDHKILEACCGALIIQLDGDECSVKEECMPMRPLDIKDATHILKTDESHGFPHRLAPFLTGELHAAVKEDVWRVLCVPLSFLCSQACSDRQGRSRAAGEA